MGQLPSPSSANLAAGRQGEQVSFDRERSQLLDTQQAALDSIADGFARLRLANQLTPANRHLPKALLATVEAFSEAVAAVHTLEAEARL